MSQFWGPLEPAGRTGAYSYALSWLRARMCAWERGKLVALKGLIQPMWAWEANSHFLKKVHVQSAISFFSRSWSAFLLGWSSDLAPNQAKLLGFIQMLFGPWRILIVDKNRSKTWAYVLSPDSDKINPTKKMREKGSPQLISSLI